MAKIKKYPGLLKKLRVVIAVPVFLLFLLLFLDFTHSLPVALYRWGEFFQFLPSMLKFIHSFSIAALGWLVVLAVTLLFGRIYCSFLCPLGISFDVMRRIAPRGVKKLPSFRRGGFLRYGILVLFLIMTAGGSMIAVNLFDPYSNFGRLMTDLLRPLVIGVNNVTARLFEGADLYILPPHDLRGWQVPVVIYGIIYAAGIIFLALRRGRLYCNTLCPVGTLLGIFSRFSLFRVLIEKKSCTACGACARVCKASCIDYQSGRVDPSRCVSCMNCLDVCSEDAIAFKFRPASQEAPDE